MFILAVILPLIKIKSNVLDKGVSEPMTNSLFFKKTDKYLF